MCVRPVLSQKSHNLQRFRSIHAFATDDCRAKNFSKQWVKDNGKTIPFGNASSGFRGAFHIAGNHDLNRYSLEAMGHACGLASSHLRERCMEMLV
jgi:hypothetical protein